MAEALELAARVRALASKQGVSATTLSRKLFGNGKRIEEIEAGGSLTLTTFRKATTLLEQMERSQ